MAKKIHGEEAFWAYYSEEYGELWPCLQSLLAQPRRHYWTVALSCHEPYGIFPGYAEGYRLDPASVHAAYDLNVQPGHRVLDACAAPGGKALVLLRMLSGQGLLHANDRSRQRLQRLQNNLNSFGLYDNFKVTSMPLLAIRETSFDRILLDAPCSSERHWLQDGCLANWRPGRSKHLAIEQHGLLCHAWQLLRPGGRLVYATCALSTRENAGVVERFLRKRQAIIVPSKYQAQACSYGQCFLPTEARDWGPLYWVILEKPGQ